MSLENLFVRGSSTLQHNSGTHLRVADLRSPVQRGAPVNVAHGYIRVCTQ